MCPINKDVLEVREIVIYLEMWKSHHGKMSKIRSKTLKITPS